MHHTLKYALLATIAISISCTRDDTSKMFTLLPPNITGIEFKNVLKETDEFNVLEYGYLYNGGGVSIGDVNNDGFSDLYFTGNMVGSRLYINQGDFKFKEIAEKAGVFAEGLWNTGTTMADVNADGLLDIYVCRSTAQASNKRRNLLFINNGDLTFTEKGAEYGVDDSGYSTQASFFDYDKDGDLDLYVLNHSIQDYAGFGQITSSLKKRKNDDYSDKLYRNDNGKFVNVSDQAGLVSNVLGFGLGIAVSDVNNDNWPDIYISNDYNEQDYLYINNHDGTFTESLEKYIGHTSLYSMGSDIADINNDGFTDIMTLDMLPEDNYRIKMVSGPDNYDKNSLLEKSGFYNQTMRNMLQINNQGRSFSEIGQFAGVSNTDWSWASLFTDLDNDGFKDLFITNGYKRDYTNMDFMNYAVHEKLKENNTGVATAISDLLEKMPATIVENYTYHNNGDLSFSKVNKEWGLDQKSLSNGASYADLDNDGDLDLVVNNIDEHPFVYRNNSDLHNTNHHLKFNFKGEGKNTFGIGSKVIINIGSEILMQELMPTRGFQSSVDFNLIFGLGAVETVDKVKIIWPDGKVQIITDVKADQTITLNQKDATLVENNSEVIVGKTYFNNITKDSLIPYLHLENDYNDFKREQLLPHKLSTQGPKITKADVNNDGLEDIFVGGAKGSEGKMFVQTPSGKFSPINEKVFITDKDSEDIGCLFLDADNDNDMDLYVVSGGSDFNENSPELQDRLYLNDGRGNFSKKTAALPKMLTSSSTVKASDIDGDGDLDLFVGGRSVPGKYPTSPRSYILENNGKGTFKDITTTVNKDLEYPGMVTDALWTDFDNDNINDLIIVGEWMGIRTFKNVKGKLVELSVNNGLNDSEGWWNSIEQGDFDKDGDMDYIIGNFGRNSQLKTSIAEPVSLYTKDFDNNGSLDPILSSYNMGEEFPVFSKDDMVGQLSGLKGKYLNYSDYAAAKITDVFNAEELKDAMVLKAKNFDTSYMENLGNGKFKLVPLPDQTQFSPIYGTLTDDIDKDGNEDIIVGGNFFGTRVKFGRYDANKGMVLFGDGKGNFRPASVMESGLNIDGEIRDITKILLADKTEVVLFVRNNDGIAMYKIESTK
ncbi:VCBS repeat-containing protein [Arenibacter sp. F26102]|uniref:VCBS repeat-containing protein n=2 Tax=Arenibacter sp. F26102 TaxID=2926416 RepID=UPI001FF6583D|nr:VCBS repeat-containing protein [Arenibacter sp. F26102]MCK0145516.1 VCBS repeat-containing protein [Arenibacter sp. F26102]